MTVDDGWLAADEYHLGLVGTTIVTRNAKGRELKSVPAKARKTEAWQQLDDLRAWLEAHDREVGQQLEQWLLGSLPVPTTVIAAVWPDESWRSWLYDLVIVDQADPTQLGLLREVIDAEVPQLGLVTLDGESIRISAEEVLIPHPALLDDLDELREFAADLGVQQRFDQLHRAVHRRGDLDDPTATALYTWAEASYAQIRQVQSRAVQGGFTPKGTDVVTRVVEQGQAFDIRINVADTTDPYAPAYTGPVRWRVNDQAVPLSSVPPVAWSEGVRMAEWIWAGREMDEEDPA